jgi:nucleoside-diphosphate-sugar epimerase
MRIFVAGAAGVIGRHLVPALLERGHQVIGTTRSQERANWLHSVGAQPALVDIFDADARAATLLSSGATSVIHQLTDLAHGFPLTGSPALSS